MYHLFVTLRGPQSSTPILLNFPLLFPFPFFPLLVKKRSLDQTNEFIAYVQACFFLLVFFTCHPLGLLKLLTQLPFPLLLIFPLSVSWLWHWKKWQHLDFWNFRNAITGTLCSYFYTKGVGDRVNLFHALAFINYPNLQKCVCVCGGVGGLFFPFFLVSLAQLWFQHPRTSISTHFIWL